MGEEEGWTLRKERRGGRRDEESEKNEKVVKKNEKVARGRIVDPRGLDPPFSPILTKALATDGPTNGGAHGRTRPMLLPCYCPAPALLPPCS